MYSQLPGIVTHKRPKRMALDDVQLSSLRKGDPIVVESGQTDAGHTGATKVLRPGQVLIKKTGSAKFIRANDYVIADQGSVATVVSAEAPDADWGAKTLKLYRNGVLVATVVAAALDDTLAEWIVVLHASKAFVANCTASDDGGGKLRITDNLGRGDALRVEVNLATAYATAGGAGSYAEADGELPDVRVTLEEVPMQDASGADVDGFCADNALAGHFRVAQLVTGGTINSVPSSAKGVLEQRGSKFVS